MAGQNEKANFVRLSRLVIGLCADILRQLLKQRVPSSQFTVGLSLYKNQLLQILNYKQKEILYPKGKSFTGNYKDFDISLLYTLLRQMGNFSPPSNGWGKPPCVNDRGVSANIERIRIVKNESYSHLPNASISDLEFKSLCCEISRAVEEIEKSTFPGSTIFKTATSNLLTEPIDPVTEEIYVEKLTQLKLEDQELKFAMREIKEKVREIEANQQSMLQRLSIGSNEEYMSTLQRNTKDNTNVMIDAHSNDETFLATKAVTVALNILDTHGIVIYKGLGGVGKTTNAKELLRLKRNIDPECSIVYLDDVRKWDDVINAKKKTIVLLDDFLGQTIRKNESVKENNKWWEKVLDCINHGEVQVILTTRTFILNSSWHLLQKCSLFKTEYIVDLSSEKFALTPDEKRDILKRHCRKNNISFCKSFEEENYNTDAILDPLHPVRICEKRLDTMASSEPVIGFLEACFLFCTNRKYTQLGVIFLNNTLSILVSELTEMGNSGDPTESLSICIVAYMLLKNGQIDINILDKGIFDRIACSYGITYAVNPLDFKRVMAMLKDKYIVQDGNSSIYTFKHQSIAEAVLKSFGENNTALTLELCDWNFISEFVRTEQYIPKDGEIVLRIEKKLYPLLVDKFMENYSINICIAHSAMDEEDFLISFMQIALHSRRYRLKLASSCRDESGIFVWACLYGRTRFVQMLSNHANQKETGSEIYNISCFLGCRSIHQEALQLTSHVITEGFCCACSEGHVETVSLLLDQSRVFDQGHIGKAFGLACREGQLKVVQCLLNKVPYLELAHIVKGLNQSCVFGHQAIVEYLIQTRKDLDKSKLCDAFRQAVGANQVSIVEFMLRTKQTKEQKFLASKTCDSLTNLHITAFTGNYTLFSKMIGIGLSPSSRTKQGISVLQAAALGYKQSGMYCMEISEYTKIKCPLLATYCTKHRGQKFGQLSDYHKILLLLIGHNDTTLSDLDFKLDAHGNTLAHFAVIQNSTSLIDILYQKYRVLLSVANAKGILPLEFALFLGRCDICKVLSSVSVSVEKSNSLKQLVTQGQKWQKRSFSYGDLRKPGLLHHVERQHVNIKFGTKDEFDSISLT